MDLSTFPEALRNKRILLCTESFGPVNGVSRTTLMLVNHLRQHGVDVAVVAPYNHTKQNTFLPSSSPSQPQPPGSDSPGTSVPTNPPPGHGNREVRLRGYPLPYNPELSIVYPVRLSTLYSRTFGADEPPDLVYIASPASLGFQVMLQMRQKPPRERVPIIANFQTALGGYCAILLPGPLGKLAEAVFAAVEGFLYRHSSVRTIFYPSSYVRRYLDDRAVPGSKLHLLQRGVDTTLFHPAKQSGPLRSSLAPNGEIVLLCVSRIAGEKGLDFLAAAIAELDSRADAVPFVLHVVGGNRNPDVFDSVRRSFPRDLVDKGRVVFAGFQVGEDLARSYATADIFLHCSVTETFGLVVLESMASGVPVVARDEGGPSDVVQHGKSGFLVPPADVGAFVDKVVMLSHDRQLRQRFAEAARAQACGATWDKINNTVAWGMVGAIEQRKRELEMPARTGRLARLKDSLSTWDSWAGYFRARRDEAKSIAGLGLISAVWGVVGLYLVFIMTSLWSRSKLRL